MIKTLGRHFRESLKSLGRNAWMSFASVSAVAVTLILVGTFLVIMMNLNHFANNIENDVVIKVLVDETASKEEQSKLETNIKGIPDIASVEFSSKEKELDKIQQGFGEQGEAMELRDQNNPLRDVFVIRAKEPQDTAKIANQIEKFDSAYKVNYGKEEVKKLFNGINIARNIGIALIIGLIFTAMFLISNTIKITIFARRREIEIMKLVGATNWFIRWPFFMEGLMLGTFGAIIPIVILIFAYNSLYTWAAPQVADSYAQLLPFNPFVWQVSVILLLIGALIGVWGSLMSIRKFLRV
ncbi:permease-like cell division protein FtsX [Metabacillus sp. KIGAM252]|uniref:Cell division protein FtsX n=1 Tax=Metabacillus flavus TaxID=2823519 RepID=A0ABS5LIR1_9BACI|nr:permease-like cell division protein FtsX [Metabacillus flavus]MBS2970622.1 permease-like cell division protein FtsX [Metabacillus flavus]